MSPNPQSSSRNILPAIVLIGLGALFLVGQIGGLGWLFSISWPLLVMAPGLVFLAVAFFGDKHAAGFFFPGTIITGIGGILAYQNMSGNWESWAYAWALIPVFVGIAMILSGRRTGSEGSIRTGRGMVTWAGIAFIALAAVFEMFIFGGTFLGIGRFLLPLLLIAAGGYLFMGGRAPRISAGDVEKPKNTLTGTGEKRKVAPMVPGEERVIEYQGENKRVPAGANLRRQIDAALKDDPSQPPQS